MRLEDIVEEFNNHIDNKRKSGSIKVKGHLVVQRVVTTNPTFKAYKTYEIILWFINCNKRYRVVTVNHTAKVSSGQEDTIEKEIDKMLCYQLFNLIGTESYINIINGTYKEDTI